MVVAEVGVEVVALCGEVSSSSMNDVLRERGVPGHGDPKSLR